MRNPFMDRASDNSRKSKGYLRSPKQEKETAKKLGGFRTPGSGSKNKKGDVFITNVARIECKTTQHKSFSVTRDMLDKIRSAAVLCNEVPAIIVEFLDSHGNPDTEVAIIEVDQLKVLIQNAAEATKTTK